MARGLFPDLESPFLDEEVLPAPPPEAESRDELEHDHGVGESTLEEVGEAAGETGLGDPELDEAGTSTDQAESIDEADQPIEEGAAEVEEALDEIREVAEASGHAYEDFEGIEDLEDTAADEQSGLNEAVDRESDEPVESREEPDEESTPGDAEPEEEDLDGPQGTSGGTSTPAITILLDEPLESDDKYQLVGSDKKYSKTLGAKDARPLVDGARRLTFGGVDANKQYQLVQIRSTGSRRVMSGMMIPYSGLTKAGQKSPQARHTYLTVPSQVPEKLPDKYRADSPVDPMLVAAAPVLVGLTVDDPKL